MSCPSLESPHLVASSRLPLRELASGVDALYLSGRGDLEVDFVRYLEESKLRATERRDGVPVSLGGEEFTIAGHGRRLYAFLLEHEHGPVSITQSERLPAIRIQPRAEFLHAVGPESVVDWYRQLLTPLCDGLTLSVSRLDLHADWQGWMPTGDDRRRFLCRATERDTFEQGEELSGFVFGRRKTKTVLGRIYDKSLEVKQEGHDWWHDVWGDAYDPDHPVVRTEFEFNRNGLKSFGIDTPSEALEAVGDLWRYATHDWLTYRVPSADSTKSRWPVAPEWHDVQQASLRSTCVGLTRIREGKKQGSLRKLLPLLNGCVVSFAALVGTRTIEDTLRHLPPVLFDYELVSRQTFEDRVDAKRIAQVLGC